MKTQGLIELCELGGRESARSTSKPLQCNRSDLFGLSFGIDGDDAAVNGVALLDVGTNKALAALPRDAIAEVPTAPFEVLRED